MGQSVNKFVTNVSLQECVVHSPLEKAAATRPGPAVQRREFSCTEVLPDDRRHRLRGVPWRRTGYGSNGPFPLPKYCALPIASLDLIVCIYCLNDSCLTFRSYHKSTSLNIHQIQCIQ